MTLQGRSGSQKPSLYFQGKQGLPRAEFRASLPSQEKEGVGEGAQLIFCTQMPGAPAGASEGVYGEGPPERIPPLEPVARSVLVSREDERGAKPAGGSLALERQGPH